MQTSVLLVLLVTVTVAVAAVSRTREVQVKTEKQTGTSGLIDQLTMPSEFLEGLRRLKRGYGGGHGHGPGKGGGAAGPVYICGYIGSKEGYGGYGR